MVCHLNIYYGNKEMVNFSVCIYFGAFGECGNEIDTYQHALYEKMNCCSKKKKFLGKSWRFLEVAKLRNTINKFLFNGVERQGLLT